MSILSVAMAAAIGTATITPIEAPGPLSPLKGSFVHGTPESGPIILVVPGSGPTDREGNNPLGVRAAPYRMLAEGLAARGIGTVLIDKRGMFASRAAVADGNDVTIADYAADTLGWVKAIREKTGAHCVWVLGHSEGGLVALAAAQSAGPEICGLILVSAGGRKMGDVMREQFRASPPMAPLLAQAEAALTDLEQGKPVDLAGKDPQLAAIFPPQVQKFLTSLLYYDPAELIARISKPILILQGDRDIQISLDDARRLKSRSPQARLVVLPGVNHVLKVVASGDRQANLAAYADPDLPLAPEIVPAIAGFVAPDPGSKTRP